MKILAFESSCDETAVAVVEDGRKILSDAIASQANLHALYGGVVPEIASRKHIEAMLDAVNLDGIPLLGYTCWGPIDIVSASTGEMKKRYGMIYVDKQNDSTGTLARSRKDSFYWYKKVIASNGEDLD